MRLFIAIRLPERLQKALLDTMDDLRRQGMRGNFSRVENLHLTLAFIGETDDPAPIREAMDAAGGQPFTLSLDEGGTFRDLYWIGLRENPLLLAYVKALRSELRARGCPYDAKPFRAHITIIRRARHPQEITFKVPQIGFKAEAVSLMKSERINGRLTYTEIYSVKLGVAKHR